jgi:hypothetical protein
MKFMRLRLRTGKAGERVRNRRGQALAEMAIILPVLLLLVFGIIELANAWRTFQVVVNGAREGARVAVLPAATVAGIEARVEGYLDQGNLRDGDRVIRIECYRDGALDGSPTCGNNRSGTESRIRVEYPYDFLLLRPIARLACGDRCGNGFGQITIASTSSMRNE